VVVLQGEVRAAAVAVHHDGADAGEGGGILGPAVEGDLGFKAGDVGEAFLKEEETGVVLMIAGAVAGRAGPSRLTFLMAPPRIAWSLAGGSGSAMPLCRHE